MSNTLVLEACEFLDAENKRAIHGDLHQIFDVLIFYASGCSWYSVSEEFPLPQDLPMVRAPHYYEGGKQIVFPLGLAAFNEVAHKTLVKLFRTERSPLVLQ